MNGVQQKVKLDVTYGLRLTSDEKTRIREAARRELMPISVWLRRVIRRALGS